MTVKCLKTNYHSRVTRYTTEQRQNINAIVANVLLTGNFSSWKNDITSQKIQQNKTEVCTNSCSVTLTIIKWCIMYYQHPALPTSSSAFEQEISYHYGYTITSAFNVCHIPYQKGSPFFLSWWNTGRSNVWNIIARLQWSLYMARLSSWLLVRISRKRRQLKHETVVANSHGFLQSKVRQRRAVARTPTAEDLPAEKGSCYKTNSWIQANMTQHLHVPGT